jgi:hypothetical protein
MIWSTVKNPHVIYNFIFELLEYNVDMASVYQLLCGKFWSSAILLSANFFTRFQWQAKVLERWTFDLVKQQNWLRLCILFCCQSWNELTLTSSYAVFALCAARLNDAAYCHSRFQLNSEQYSQCLLHWQYLDVSRDLLDTGHTADFVLRLKLARLVDFSHLVFGR